MAHKHTFFFNVLSRASYGYIQCGFIPSVVWRFAIKISSSVICTKLASTMKTSYKFMLILGVVGSFVGIVRHLGMSDCLSVCYFGICTSTSMSTYMSEGYIHKSVCSHTSICPSVHLYIPHASWRHSGRMSVFQTYLCLSVYPFVCKFIHCLLGAV